jgi:hypothetical protein
MQDGSGQQDPQCKSTTWRDQGSDNRRTRNTGSSDRPPTTIADPCRHHPSPRRCIAAISCLASSIAHRVRAGLRKLG